MDCRFGQRMWCCSETPKNQTKSSDERQRIWNFRGFTIPCAWEVVRSTLYHSFDFFIFRDLGSTCCCESHFAIYLNSSTNPSQLWINFHWRHPVLIWISKMIIFHDFIFDFLDTLIEARHWNEQSLTWRGYMRNGSRVNLKFGWRIQSPKIRKPKKLNFCYFAFWIFGDSIWYGFHRKCQIQTERTSRSMEMDS